MVQADSALLVEADHFATAVDVTLSELHLEAFLPADDATATLLRHRAGLPWLPHNHHTPHIAGAYVRRTNGVWELAAAGSAVADDGGDGEDDDGADRPEEGEG